MTFLLLICTVYLAWLSFTRHKKFKVKLNEASHLASELAQRNKLLEKNEQELSELQKYKTIVDVEAYVRDLKQNAESEANSLTSTAKVEAKTLKEKSESTLASAINQAANIVKLAEDEAKRIAGDAFEALKKAELLEKTAKAMKNIIEGYGDQYVIPITSLLDNLAESFSHTDAGQELKGAREKTRSMIKNGTAALCEYAEMHRRQTAINFVLDAFNGKVDTILSAVKEDNFGTLEQKIRDAFQTVNFNGSAFRDARIAELYLSARLSELQWACTVQAIKERDREEQRRIKEQIREEEKAARDYERAQKEAQKEEETIGKAMEKARKDLENASELQKEQYELKLAELTKKLAEAEEKNKRALSMAQQTKTGNVYIISNIGSFGEDVFKIGMTRRLDPQDRVDELGDASVPFEFDVHAMILSDDAPALEKELHKQFSEAQVNQVNSRKEFFRISLAALKDAIEKLGIQTQWTMTAEAKQYRESLAITARRNAA